MKSHNKSPLGIPPQSRGKQKNADDWASVNQGVEFSLSLREVLRESGFSHPSLNLEAYERLPNLRRFQPAPIRQHTPWQILRHEALCDLPPLEDILFEMGCMLCRDQCPPCISDITEVWRGEEKLPQLPPSQELAAWVQQINREEPSEQRLVNASMKGVISDGQCRRYSAQASSTAEATFGEGQVIELPTSELNLTPRHTVASLHHDSMLGVNTAIGFQRSGRHAVKLWVLWPSTELYRIAGKVGNSNAAIHRLEHGSFLVQMTGETVVVPPNAPHIVFTLNSSYIYGCQYSAKGAWDPPSLAVDIESGQSGALTLRIDALERGLRDDKWRDTYIANFQETWALDGPYILGKPAQLKKMAKVWADDARLRESCVLCLASGVRSFGKEDVRQHAVAHLTGKHTDFQLLSA